MYPLSPLLIALYGCEMYAIRMLDCHVTYDFYLQLLNNLILLVVKESFDDDY